MTFPARRAETGVHWGRWNFVPTESHPMGGMEFQVVLALVMLYPVITGNQGLKQSAENVQAA